MIKNITLIAGARPNFMKIGAQLSMPLMQAKGKTGKIITYRLVTQRATLWQKDVCDIFLNKWHSRGPNVNLGAGGGSQAETNGQISNGPLWKGNFLAASRQI